MDLDEDNRIAFYFKEYIDISIQNGICDFH